jgi:hypothetical protein
MLHVIYRSYGGENTKGRPAYYSKLLSLVSFIRAFRQLKEGTAEIIFLNDGPIPEDRLRIMERSGEVVARSKLGLRGSWLSTLAIPHLRSWPDDDLVWLSEDDYLYLPHALSNLAAAAGACPDASYFGLYAMIGNRQPNGLPSVDRVPKRLPAPQTTLVDGHPWRRALSTTATFGARVRPLLEDRSMMKVAIYSGGAWDHTACLMYQGFQPYPMSFLVKSLIDPEATKSWLHRLCIFYARMGLNFYQLVRAPQESKRRCLMAADPALITHVETPFLAQGTDWQSFAASIQQWMNAEWHMAAKS